MNPAAVWRLCAAQFSATAFDGEGARLYGGRWSPPGIALVYCAESRALAVLEVLANTDEPVRLVNLDWVLLSAEFPSAVVERPTRVPESWRQFPHSREVQEFGAAWAREQRSAVLRVPSAVVPGEFNYLLNPLHPDFKKVKIGKSEPFAFDARLGPGGRK